MVVLVVVFLGWCRNVARRAHLDSQRQLGVDAVSGLCALLRCHFIGIEGLLGGGRGRRWSFGC